MSAIVELIGDKVKGKDGAVDTSSFTGEGKVVGKFFNDVILIFPFNLNKL